MHIFTVALAASALASGAVASWAGAGWSPALSVPVYSSSTKYASYVTAASGTAPKPTGTAPIILFTGTAPLDPSGKPPIGIFPIHGYNNTGNATVPPLATGTGTVGSSSTVPSGTPIKPSISTWTGAASAVTARAGAGVIGLVGLAAYIL